MISFCFSNQKVKRMEKKEEERRRRGRGKEKEEGDGGETGRGGEKKERKCGLPVCLSLRAVLHISILAE